MCKDPQCKRLILGSIDSETKLWKMKTYEPKHSCNWTLTISNVNYKMLANNPIKNRNINRSAIARKLVEIQDVVKDELKVNVSLT